MRMRVEPARAHRTRRPIIGSPDAQPAATPAAAVGDGSPFLRLPRHRRPLPVSGARPPEPRRRRRRNDALDRPCRPRRCSSRRCSPCGSSGSARSVPVAVAARRDRAPSRLLIVVSAIPNGGRRGHRRGKARPSFAVLTLGAAAFLDTRQRFADARRGSSSPSAPSPSPGAPSSSSVNGGERQGSFMGEHDLAALATMALVRRARVRSSHRDRRPPARRARRDRRRRVGIVLGASLASLLGLYLGRGRDDRARARAPRPALGAPSSSPSLICAAVTAGTLGLRSGDLGFLQSWFGPPPETPGPVRGELEPPADLRLHRRPRLPRQPGPRHRLGGRAAPGGLRAVPPRRARALPRPAAALLPAGRRTLHPAADVRPGALRARPRRGGGLPRARRRSRSARDRRRSAAAAGRAVGRAGVRAAGLARGRSAARSPARRSSAARRWPRSSG